VLPDITDEDAPTLARALAEAGGPLPPGRAAAIADGILAALAAAPGHHGALRPDRVFVGPPVHLTAFGVGPPAPDYQAPEQALEEPVGPAADVYAVGVMLHEMLAGRRPFEGRSTAEVIQAHLVRPPRPLPADVPPALAEVAGRALEKRAGARLSGAELRAALRPFLQTDAAAAPQPEPVEESEREATVRIPPTPGPVIRETPVQRRPVLAIGLGAAALAAVIAYAAIRRPSPRVLAAPALPALADRLEKARAQGDLAGARAQAEAWAKQYPDDASAYALLGNVLFAEGEKQRALASYRAALRLDRAVGTDAELLANLRATFADPQFGEAAFRLVEEIGPPAAPIVTDFGASTQSAPLKRRAADAMARIAAKGENR